MINSGRDLYGYYHDFNNDGENITIASRGEYAGFINYFNEKFFAGGLCYPYKVKDTNELLTKFLYFYLKTNEIQIMENLVFRGSIPALNKADIETLTIPIPPLEIQQEIVKILDAFTELNTELKARKKQYQYYQNMLLDFNDINQSHKDAKEKLAQKPYPKRLKTLLQTLAPKGVEFRKLGDIGEFTRGNGLLKSDLQDKGRPVVHYGQIHTQYNLSIDKTISYVNDALFHKLKKAKPNDILIATTSENVKDVGKSIAWLGNEEIAFSGDMYSYSTNENPKFIIYYFQTWFFQKEKEKRITGTKVMRIHENDLKQITIPIPPLEIQQEIVKILDQFSLLTTDLLAGIPAEIKARKKQYEYYREKLLTFKPLQNKE
ncbi:putative type I restriction enzyme (specificity subunit) [Helicobacter pylori ELS37]|uniref:Type I restriction enzyme (Specificity subunit) n=1 Tax=Helicobacter pylori ELS37 TaxID=1055527 RepID=A0ABC7ZEU8_HELPX|nr:putative type I restriction enzyme (specificity subunit) [Helicobacter pylori ELS37]